MRERRDTGEMGGDNYSKPTVRANALLEILLYPLGTSPEENYLGFTEKRPWTQTGLDTDSASIT